ncbi:MAG: YegP family protein [Planctomycetota bacterium]
MAAKYDLKPTSDGQFMFNLKAANGEIILTSERYKQKASAENGIESVRTNSPLDERYDRRTSSAGSPYFVLKAGNGEIIGKSEMYSGDAAMENGIASVKQNGPSARLDDHA